MEWLVNTIEAEIIPRLMAAHRDGSGRAPSGSAVITDEDIAGFAEISLHGDAAACLAFIEGVRGRGTSLENVYLSLIAPAARRLGTMWIEDTCDFTEVTVGLWRMQQAMYDLSPEFHTDCETPALGQRRIMLCTIPGSQHTLGILMVAEFFRRSGWCVGGEPAATREDLVRNASQQWFDVIGISIGSEPQLAFVKEIVSALRDASQNKSVRIMLGGPVSISADAVRSYGADAVAGDAQQAIQIAEQLATAKRAS